MGLRRIDKYVLEAKLVFRRAHIAQIAMYSRALDSHVRIDLDLYLVQLGLADATTRKQMTSVCRSLFAVEPFLNQIHEKVHNRIVNCIKPV